MVVLLALLCVNLFIAVITNAFDRVKDMVLPPPTTTRTVLHNNTDCPPARWPESPRIAVQRGSLRIKWPESPRAVRALQTDEELRADDGPDAGPGSLQTAGQVSKTCLTAATPMDSHALQLQSRWIIPTAAVS